MLHLIKNGRKSIEIKNKDWILYVLVVTNSFW